MHPAPVAVSLPIVVLAGVFGLAVGSFLNVVIYRVPRGESLISPGSRCPTCDTPLKARHNIPVVSWLALRGRCAYCAAPISLRYPLVEAGTAALFVCISLRFGLVPQLPAFLYLATIAITLALIQVDVRRLPDSIVVPSYIISGLLLVPAGAYHGGWWAGERAVLGMLALLVLSFGLWFALPTFIGFGDVRLAGLLGLYLGWISWSALAAATLGAVVIAVFAQKAVELTARARRRLLSFTAVSDTAGAVPLAPCLLAAAVLTLFIAAPATTFYSGVLG